MWIPGAVPLEVEKGKSAPCRLRFTKDSRFVQDARSTGVGAGLFNALCFGLMEWGDFLLFRSGSV